MQPPQNLSDPPEAQPAPEATRDRELLDRMADAYFELDAGDRLVALNARQARHWSTPREGLLGRPVAELLAAGSREKVLGELRRARSLGVAVHFVEQERASGRWIERDAYPTGDGSVAVFSRDVTARRQAERALERTRFLAAASEALAGTLDYEATLSRVASAAVPAFADWAALDLLDEEGQVRRVAVAHSDPDRARQARAWFERYPPTRDGPTGVAEVLRTGEPRLVGAFPDALLKQALAEPERLAYVRGLGLKSSIVVPLGARGRIFGALSLVTAESNRRFAQEDLGFALDLARRASLALENARLFREAQDASRIKDEFLAAVSHELRTPLTAILGWTRALRTTEGSAERLARALAAIERNARSQAQLIDDLLDISSVVGGRLTLELEELDPVEPVGAAVQAATPAAVAKELELDFTFDPRLGRIRADRARLQQVAWNLLANAVRFSARGGRVGISLRRDGVLLRLEVADDGEGIAPENLARLFDGFRRGPDARRTGSLGLGLAIARRVVELHGGQIEAFSDGPGKGARFVVSLPLPAR